MLSENSITLTDVSALPRFGVKGAGAAAWLQTHGLPVPDYPEGGTASLRPNSWLPLENDGRIARLGLTEFLIEGEIASQLQSDLSGLNIPPQVYPVLRQDLAIVLTGEAVHDLFAQTCNVNFRPLRAAAMSGSFNPGDYAERETVLHQPVVLTSMIGVSVTVAIEDTPIPQYRLWCDTTYRNYVLQTLSEIISELDSLPNRPPNPPIMRETEPKQAVLSQKSS